MTKKNHEFYKLNKEKITELYNSGKTISYIQNSEWGRNPETGKPASRLKIVRSIIGYKASPTKATIDEKKVRELYISGYSTIEISNMPVAFNPETGKIMTQ